MRFIRLNHIFHSCNEPPSIPLSLNLAIVILRRSISHVSCKHKHRVFCFYTHRSPHGLPGYQILFATHAFVPQRQFNIGKPSPHADSPINFYKFNLYINSTIFLLKTLEKKVYINHHRSSPSILLRT